MYNCRHNIILGDDPLVLFTKFWRRIFVRCYDLIIYKEPIIYAYAEQETTCIYAETVYVI
jgi:hypothetical protein